MAGAPKLPVELYRQIVRDAVITNEDLVNLCLVERAFSAEVRPVLYRHIKFKDYITGEMAVRTLSKSTELAKLVFTLAVPFDLDDTYLWQEAQQDFIVAVHNMVNLHVLHITRPLNMPKDSDSFELKWTRPLNLLQLQTMRLDVAPRRNIHDLFGQLPHPIKHLQCSSALPMSILGGACRVSSRYLFGRRQDPLPYLECIEFYFMGITDCEKLAELTPNLHTFASMRALDEVGHWTMWTNYLNILKGLKRIGPIKTPYLDKAIIDAFSPFDLEIIIFALPDEQLADFDENAICNLLDTSPTLRKVSVVFAQSGGDTENNGAFASPIKSPSQVSIWERTLGDRSLSFKSLMPGDMTDWEETIRALLDIPSNPTTSARRAAFKDTQMYIHSLLPLELYRQIVRDPVLDKQDVLNLCLASRALSAEAYLTLYRRMYFKDLRTNELAIRTLKSSKRVLGMIHNLTLRTNISSESWWAKDRRRFIALVNEMNNLRELHLVGDMDLFIWRERFSWTRLLRLPHLQTLRLEDLWPMVPYHLRTLFGQLPSPLPHLISNEDLQLVSSNEICHIQCPRLSFGENRVLKHLKWLEIEDINACCAALVGLAPNLHTIAHTKSLIRSSYELPKLWDRHLQTLQSVKRVGPIMVETLDKSVAECYSKFNLEIIVFTLEEESRKDFDDSVIEGMMHASPSLRRVSVIFLRAREPSEPLEPWILTPFVYHPTEMIIWNRSTRDTSCTSEEHVDKLHRLSKPVDAGNWLNTLRMILEIPYND